MEQVVTAAEMVAIDEKARRKISAEKLMEQAGYLCWQFITNNLLRPKTNRLTLPLTATQNNWQQKVVNLIIFCGKGNNGGDGCVLARHALLDQLFLAPNPHLLAPFHLNMHLATFTASLGSLTEVHRQNRNSLKKLGNIPFKCDTTKHVDDWLKNRLIPLIQTTTQQGALTIVVDALAGTGTKGPLRGLYREAAQAIYTLRSLVEDVAVTKKTLHKLHNFNYLSESEHFSLPNTPADPNPANDNKPPTMRFTVNPTKPLVVIALDLPSGAGVNALKCDTFSLGEAIAADITLALAYYKTQHFTPLGRYLSGELHQLPLSLPQRMPAAPQTISPPLKTSFLVEASDVLVHLPELQANDYKKTRGHVIVAAGTTGMLGAAILATKAASRSFAGVVTLLTQEQDLALQASRLQAEYVTTLTAFMQQHTCLEIGQKFQCVLLGPGIGTKKLAIYQKFLEQLKPCIALKTHPTAQSAQTPSAKLPTKLPIVLDANGIDLLLKIATPSKTSPPWIPQHLLLTPHVGELARLMDVSTEKLLADPLPTLKKAAQRYQAVVLFKAQCLVIQSPSGHTAYVEGNNPMLGTGGSGDVLAGMVTALVGYRLQKASLAAGDKVLASAVVEEILFTSAWMAAWLHQRAGRLASAEEGVVSAAVLPKYLARLSKDLLRQ